MNRSAPVRQSPACRNGIHAHRAQPFRNDAIIDAES